MEGGVEVRGGEERWRKQHRWMLRRGVCVCVCVCVCEQENEVNVDKGGFN